MQNVSGKSDQPDDRATTLPELRMIAAKALRAAHNVGDPTQRPKPKNNPELDWTAEDD